MDLLCHRCGDTLAQASAFCGHCGAPQLRYTAQETDFLPGSNGEASPAPQAQSMEYSGVQWRPVIRIALWVSLGAGILSSVLAAASLLWILGGAVLVIVLYRRSVPNALLQPGQGARIGMLTGTLTAAAAMASNTLLLVIQRFVLHQGSQLDATLNSTMQQAMTRATSGAEAQAQMASTVTFLLSPEGRAGMVLLGMGFIAAVILLLSVAGGVLGTRMYRSRSKPQPTA
jgi:ribosomal protein L40E